MRVRPELGLALVVVGATWLFQPGHSSGQDASAPPTASQPNADADALERLVDELGHEQYTRREEATQRLLAEGSAVVPHLRARLLREGDPEIRHRLRYILENIVPPRQAVLLIRAAPETGLLPGELVTHANSRRVRSQAELRRRMGAAPRGSSLQVRGPSGPREVALVQIGQLIELCDYAAPRGETLARAVRLYASGFAEEAYRVLRELPEPIPENELSQQLHALIAYTAGDGTTALELMNAHGDSVRASGVESWSSPSHLDLKGPGKAPFHLEWVVASQAGRDAYTTNYDPDLRIQRILVPARRYADTLERTAGYWWRQFRSELGRSDDSNHVAGNQLAVAAWMLHAMDLRSECCRLIEPRSAILYRSPRGSRKWLRVETDAWLPLLGGDAKAALDGFYEHALDVLQRPPRPGDRSVLTRNPRVAARVAFFLYQFPDDQRIEKTLQTVGHHTHPALTDYLDWMLYALQEETRAAIRRDLQALLPQLSDAQVRPYARAVALLEYARRKPSADVLRTARRRVSNSPPGEQRDAVLATVDALVELSEGRPNNARRILLPFRDRPEMSALRHTAAFLRDPPESAANHAALRRPLLAVPVGWSREHWLILARDRRLLHFDATAGLLTALDKPTPTWFPNPLTWPWIGREERNGRVWVYCRRRLAEIELDTSGDRSALRVRPALNLRTEDIPAFHRYVGPRFSQLAAAIADATPPPGENSEFLRSEIRAHGEYCADPDLPEVGMIQALPQAARVVHVALRGGPHLLIDTTASRSWTSQWIGGQLDLKTPPTFFAQALWEADDGSPIVVLMSDQGLIRFELGTERLTRIALPGAEAYPALIPESTPYERRDPRYVYCARLPEDGGQVYRLSVADNSVEEVDMVNEALPEHYYDIQARAAIRAALDRRFGDAGLPELEAFISDAAEAVARWIRGQQTEP